MKGLAVKNEIRKEENKNNFQDLRSLDLKKAKTSKKEIKKKKNFKKVLTNGKIRDIIQLS